MSRYSYLKYRREQAELNDRWWACYNKYTSESPLWRRRRELVLKRADQICECCGVARATEVHHVTYEHVGHEPLWELHAICKDCHDAITDIDRYGRRTEDYDPWTINWDPWRNFVDTETLEVLIKELPDLRADG